MLTIERAEITQAHGGAFLCVEYINDYGEHEDTKYGCASIRHASELMRMINKGLTQARADYLDDMQSDIINSAVRGKPWTDPLGVLREALTRTDRIMLGLPPSLRRMRESESREKRHKRKVKK